MLSVCHLHHSHYISRLKAYTYRLCLCTLLSYLSMHCHVLHLRSTMPLFSLSCSALSSVITMFYIGFYCIFSISLSPASLQPKRYLDRISRFARLMVVTNADTQTDGHICRNRRRLCTAMHVMRPKICNSLLLLKAVCRSVEIGCCM